jgi:hypothetical protein
VSKTRAKQAKSGKPCPICTLKHAPLDFELTVQNLMKLYDQIDVLNNDEIRELLRPGPDVPYPISRIFP